MLRSSWRDVGGALCGISLALAFISVFVSLLACLLLWRFLLLGFALL